MKKLLFLFTIMFLFSCEKPKKEGIETPEKFCWKCTTKLGTSVLQSGIQIKYIPGGIIAVINKCEMTVSEARALEASLTSIETSIDGSLTTVVRKITECKNQ